ncbi:MAG: right-handed parallel beta-helix repeat-containing protein [Chitinophagaceae bacterium]|nr:right-handed parallel beta-helix repeat-containing protein [Chitinophagaceae bacterium]
MFVVVILRSFTITFISLFIPQIFFAQGSIPATDNINQAGWIKKVGARKFPSGKQIFFVNRYGAISDGVTISTKAIQKAVDACSAKGGGVVRFKPGTYVTGAIFLKKNVNLHIDQGVLILGSESFSDYPEIDTRIAGIEMKWPAALINILNTTNAALSGPGIINARGKFCWDKYWAMRREYEPKGLRWIVDYDAKRVRTILVQNSSDITVKEITVKNAGFWTVQLLYSDHLTVDGLIVRNNEDGKGPSTDGVDVDSSSWVLIENCDIDCNDDDFVLKSGRDWDGLRVNRPTEYVVIRKCIARKGGGLVTLGSETSGGIRHVLATDLVGKGTGNGFHIKSATTRGGIVEDIHFQNIQMDSVGTAFQFTMNWNPAYSYSKLPDGYHYDSLPAHWKTLLQKVEPSEKGIPTFRNIYVSNITATGVTKVVNAAGLIESALQGFHFNNVNVRGKSAGGISYAKNWVFSDVMITGADGKPLNVANSEEMKLGKN